MPPKDLDEQNVMLMFASYPTLAKLGWGTLGRADWHLLKSKRGSFDFARMGVRAEVI